MQPCLQLVTVCEQVAKEPPNVFLVDTNLRFPASGWRVLQALREQESTREVPVIVCSDHTRELEGLYAGVLPRKSGPNLFDYPTTRHRNELPGSVSKLAWTEK